MPLFSSDGIKQMNFKKICGTDDQSKDKIQQERGSGCGATGKILVGMKKSEQDVSMQDLMIEVAKEKMSSR